MSTAELAERTGLAINTVRKAEKSSGQPEITAANLRLIQQTLEAAGVVIIPADKLGVGVRLKGDEVEQLQRRRTR